MSGSQWYARNKDISNSLKVETISDHFLKLSQRFYSNVDGRIGKVNNLALTTNYKFKLSPPRLIADPKLAFKVKKRKWRKGTLVPSIE
jgi:hypothetical protein